MRVAVIRAESQPASEEKSQTPFDIATNVPKRGILDDPRYAKLALERPALAGGRAAPARDSRRVSRSASGANGAAVKTNPIHHGRPSRRSRGRNSI
jgi:hypothetical protein